MVHGRHDGEEARAAETLSYDDLEVGSPLARTSFRVTREAVERFCEATAPDPSSRTIKTPNGAKAPVPPAFASVYIRASYASLRSPGGGIHAKQRYCFHAPIFVDDVITTHGSISELYVKREKPYVALETKSFNQDGTLVTSGWALRIWPAGDDTR